MPGMYFLSEVFSLSWEADAFNFVSYFENIFVQCWDGSIKIIQESDTQNIKSAAIPDFTLPGIMKIFGDIIVLCQGNHILGLAMDKLISGHVEFIIVNSIN